MSTISQLSAAAAFSLSDLFAIYSQTNGDTRKVSGYAVQSVLLAGITASDDKVTQYASPSATAFLVTLTDNDDSKWLVLTPTAGFADGTIKLPALASCVDRQEILVNCTQAVTNLVVDGNGATVTGEPATLAANAFFRLRFEAVTDTWYRVG